ncbi:MAG: hypothetical protein ACE5EE_06950 [Fidelibacterota bacterium]
MNLSQNISCTKVWRVGEWSVYSPRKWDTCLRCRFLFVVSKETDDRQAMDRFVAAGECRARSVNEG